MNHSFMSDEFGAITPRWIAFVSFALLLLFSGRYVEWIIMVFPLWVLLISIYILTDNLHRTSQAAARSLGQKSTCKPVFFLGAPQRNGDSANTINSYRSLSGSSGRFGAEWADREGRI